MKTSKGQCQCGCGKKTGTYSRTRPERGQIKGELTEFLTGHKSYRWKIISLNPSGLCQCGCGSKTEISKGLKTETRCFKGQPKFFILGHSPIKHGQNRRNNTTSEYRAYTDAKTRCTNPKNKITVDEE